MRDTQALGDRMNAVNNDVQQMLGRFDEALDMLAIWAVERTEDPGLVRMTNNLLVRCGRDAVTPDDDKAEDR